MLRLTGEDARTKRQKTAELDSPPVTVIVQGFPPKVVNKDCDLSDFFGAKDVTPKDLKQLFSKYGTVSGCTMYKRGGRYGPENFAYITYVNNDAAVKAHAAAMNHEIKMVDSVLTVTLLPDDCAPIEKLNDHCLIKVFSLLQKNDRINVEKVCKRWRDLALRSWFTVKTFNGNDIHNETQFKGYINRCGCYLNDLTFSMHRQESLPLIQKRCKNVKSVTITNCHRNNLDKVSEALGSIKTLRSLTLRDIEESIKSDTLVKLPESMEEIQLFAQLPMYSRSGPSCSQDFSKFHNLQKLVINRFTLGDAPLNFYSLTQLTHLDLTKCGNSTSTIRQIHCLTNLKFLAISSSTIGDDDLREILISNQGLEYLDISRMDSITDESLNAVSKLPHLKSLKMGHLRKISLKLMSDMSTVEYLDCQCCSGISGEDFCRVITILPALKYLNTAGCHISESFFNDAAAAVESRGSSVVLRLATHKDYVSKISPLLVIEHRPYYAYPCTSDESD